MKVLLNDGMHADGIEYFKKRGIETDKEKRDGERLLKEIREFDALSVRSATKVTREVIEAGVRDGGKLAIIGRAGVGFDNIDIEAASENGIIVKYAPHGNTTSTAELALGLMLAVARNIPQAHSYLTQSLWKKKQFQGIELSHKTLGIIGCGRIGQRLSELVSGLDMDVIGYDMDIERVSALFPDSRIKYLPKEEVLSQADFISVHTGGKNVVIGKQELDLMKENAILINASRGGNIDEEELYEALKEGKILGAGLDTYKGEPKKEGGELTPTMEKLSKLENVVMTSHLGASTDEAQRKTSLEMARVVANYLLGTGDIYENAVNVKEKIEEEALPVYPLRIHHRDVKGAFGKIGDVLGKHGINIRDNPSRELLGDSGYVTTTYLVHQKPDEEAIRDLKQLEIVKRIVG